MTSYHGSLYRDLPLVGAVTVPGDKSLSHRVALFAALAEGTSQVRGLLDSFDVRSTLDAVAALGAVVDVSEDGSGGLSGSITGWGKVGAAAPAALMNSGNFGGEGAAAPAALIDCRNSSGEGIAAPVVQIDCGNSGTTTRLLLGLLSGYPLTVQLTGDESLSRRPMKRVTEPLRTMGACFTQTAATPLPLIVQGSTHLSAIDYHSPVASAQVKSAVLLAGLHAKGTTTVTEPRLSRNHTELLLPAFGVEVKVSDDGLTTSILGGQNAKACDCVVPKDPSSAAFLLAAAALIPGSCVTARGISLNPTRTGFLSVMRRMGVKIAIVNSNLGSFGDEPIESFEDETIESFEDEVGGSAGADSMESLGAEPRGKLGAESKGGLGAESRGMLGAESKGGPGAESKRSIGAEPVGDVCVCYTRELKAVTVAADEIPSLIDEIPILALLATACKGETRFCEVGELRVKESDRLAAVIAGLTALGCSARAEGDDLVIEGHEGFMSDTRKTRLPIHTLSGRQLNQSNDSPAGSFASGFALRSGRHEEGLAHIDERHEEGLASNEGPSLTTPSALLTHNDHRLAMTWIVAARAFCIDLDIEGIESMGVSYPGFSNDLESLSATRAIT